MTLNNTDLLARVRAHFRASLPTRLGVAVSGGSDSVALLVLLKQLCQLEGVDLHAATVDHGLRPEAADEAAGVAEFCQSLNVPHTVLTWGKWDGTGNLQDQARRARYDLLTNWAKSNDIAVLAVGHTADDQAETVLMRLSRSAGVDGLSGMSAVRTENGISLIRPLLGCGRDELRDFLTQQGVSWIDDPSNEDDRFDRIRARRVMAELAPLGITVQGVADVAQNMLRAREALDWYTFLAARDLATVHGGCVVMDPRKFRILPEEIARRLLVRALGWIGGAEYPPRRQPLMDLLDKTRHGQGATLAGCRVFSHQGKIWICREYNAVRDLCVPGTEVWDNRWILTGPWQDKYQIRALGRDGVTICKPDPSIGLPRIVLEASPAVWSNDNLVAAPLAGFGLGWHAELVGGGEEFFAVTLSH